MAITTWFKMDILNNIDNKFKPHLISGVFCFIRYLYYMKIIITEKQYKTLRRRFSFDSIEDLFDDAMLNHNPCDYDDEELGVYDFFNDIKYDVTLTVLNRLGYDMDNDEGGLGIVLMDDIENLLFDKKFETSEKYFNSQRIHC